MHLNKNMPVKYDVGAFCAVSLAGSSRSHMEIIRAVAFEKNVPGNKLSECHMMILEDESRLPSTDWYSTQSENMVLFNKKLALKIFSFLSTLRSSFPQLRVLLGVLPELPQRVPP